ncbi:MAG: hypothetical protein HOV80_06845 [Polyangiaceae bacterium]|nr:hypothetical protein [Polyangiaceae bacterium]
MFGAGSDAGWVTITFVVVCAVAAVLLVWLGRNARVHLGPRGVDVDVKERRPDIHMRKVVTGRDIDLHTRGTIRGEDLRAKRDVIAETGEKKR